MPVKTCTRLLEKYGANPANWMLCQLDIGAEGIDQPPAVKKAIVALERLKLIEHRDGDGWHLTESGRREAHAHVLAASAYRRQLKDAHRGIERAAKKALDDQYAKGGLR